MARHALLRAPAAALAALLIAACGGGGSGDSGGLTFKPSSDPARNIPLDQRDTVNIVVAGGEFTVGWNNFVFGLTNRADEPQGGAHAVATFYDLRDSANPKPVFQAQAVASAPGVGPTFTHVHSSGETHTHGGQDEDRVGYYVRVKFDHPGFWGIAVEAKLKDGTRGVSNAGFEVFAKARIPAPGTKAPRSDNLTARDVPDIGMIDSGEPPNDMHDVKIKDAIAAGRPLVIVFATPAFCSSRFCGPVIEEVESLHDDFKDRVDFVHIEIWLDFNAKQLNPTTREWLVRADGGLNEPFVFVVDRAGVIYDRWEGPVARNIVEQAVKDVAGGKLYSN